MFGLNAELLQWLRSGDHLFYAYHQCARAKQLSFGNISLCCGFRQPSK